MKAFAAILCCIFATGCDVRNGAGQKADDPAMAVKSKTHEYIVQWGYRGDELAYVCIVGQRLPVGSVTGIVSGGVSGDKRDFYVCRPDGSKVAVPGKIQLFELIDGQYRESTERVSLGEFKAFEASLPEEYSIDAVVRFAQDRRRHQK